MAQSNAPFMVSAPGKVIVFGEHAVVYGKAAIAAATSLRSYLYVSFNEVDDGTTTIDFLDLGLKHTWHYSQLRENLPWASSSIALPKAPKSLDPRYVQAVDENIRDVSPHEQNKVKRAMDWSVAKAFLYLFLNLGLDAFPSCTFTLRSTLPIGAGLGSSASVSVCMSAAMLYQRQLLQGGDEIAQQKQMVSDVNDWSLVGEMCIHGNPSGVDNAVATFGKAVMFRREGGPDNTPLITPLECFPEVRLLLVDTGVSRSTAREVEKVRGLKSELPLIADSVLECSSQISISAHQLFNARQQGKLDQLPGPRLSFHERLGQLFRMSHGLLVSLGVSHPRIERIRQITEEEDVGWTKLTGAGGGGCTITLLREHDTSLEDVESRLIEEGFKQYELVLGAPGIGIHQNMKHVSREAFLGAETTEALEAVLGMTDSSTDTCWKFWSGQ